jgi:basic amino acid/polyamine antiporter, APA family
VNETNPITPPHGNTLPRVLGPLAAYAFVIGSVIGSGIFMKPATIAAAVGDFRWIVLVWIAAGAVTLFGALTVAELASLFPQAGGPYVYLREAYGKLPAFLWGWTEFLIIRTASIGALVTACVIYTNQALPDDVKLSYLQLELLACALIVVLAAVASLSTRGSGGVQILTVAAKSSLILLIVVLPFVTGAVSTANLSTTTPPKNEYRSLVIGLGAALLAVWWAYDGWINLGPLAEDVRDPQKNLPRAMFWGVATIIALYLVATLAYHLVMPMWTLGASKAPAADALELAWSDSRMRIVAAIGVAISTLGTAAASITIGPRVIFAMSRDGLLPAPLSRIHPRFQTPMFAIATQAFWALLLVHYCFVNAPWESGHAPGAKAATAVSTHDEDGREVVGGDVPMHQNPREAFDGLTNIAIFGGSIFYALAVAAVYKFRRTHPDLPRPYKTWGYPVTPALMLIAFGAVIVTLFAQQPKESMLGLGIMAVGGLYYFIWNRGPRKTIAT